MIWPLQTPNNFVGRDQKHKVWVLVFLVRMIRALLDLGGIFCFSTKPHLLQQVTLISMSMSRDRERVKNVVTGKQFIETGSTGSGRYFVKTVKSA